MDFSNGYEKIAAQYLSARGKSSTGKARISQWAATLSPGSKVLDIGCGNGIPVTRTVLAAGHAPFAIDPSESMIRAFRQRFPTLPAECAAAEHSDFFGETFEGVIAIGVIFLLKASTQLTVIRRVGEILLPDGRFLFTAPIETGEWNDMLTGQPSLSLGRAAYERALAAAGMQLLECYADEGGNNYYSAIRLRQVAGRMENRP